MKVLDSKYNGITPLAVAVHRACSDGILRCRLTTSELPIEQRKIYYRITKKSIEEGHDISTCLDSVRLDSKNFNWTDVPLTIHKQIGQGFFGRVYKGMKKTVPVAWKKAMGDVDSVFHLISELKILR